MWRACVLCKRVFDVVMSGVALMLLSPLMITLAFLVLLDLGWPVFFRQVRPGIHGIPFTMFKFRTMREIRNDDGKLLSNELRLTSFGRLLRSTSLDELPELWNVLNGHMSFVGPRPLLMDYLPLYSSEQNRRHEVRPGITGWAQINGRNTATWKDRFQMDVWYVDNRTFMLDMRVLAITLAKVVAREGVSQPGKVTIDRFTGKNCD